MKKVTFEFVGQDAEEMAQKFGLSTLFQTTFLRVCFSNSFGVK